jgi:mono/diheme cytochrome c family protein
VTFRTPSLSLIVVVVAATTLGAQTPDGAVRDGDEQSTVQGGARYTEEQSDAGRVEFERKCASCHMPDASGDRRAPALVGPGFRGRWGDRRVRDLFVRMRAGMPPIGVRPRAGGFTRILAYLLQANGLPAGPEALDPLSYGKLGLSP